MATFTIELWRVLELEEDPGDGSTVGLADYPIPAAWTPEFRDALNEKILRHYWNREIGMETISMFAFAIRRRMHEVMPLYVKVYESEMLEFDPLSNVVLSTARDDEAKEASKRKSTNTADTDSSGGSRNLNSNFPQANFDPELNGEFYASDGQNQISSSKAKTTGGGEDTTDGTTTAKGKSTTTGRQGSASDLLLRYRATFLNVDMLVIGELADCFMQVWDNGEEHLPASRRFGALY